MPHGSLLWVAQCYEYHNATIMVPLVQREKAKKNTGENYGRRDFGGFWECCLATTDSATRIAAFAIKLLTLLRSMPAASSMSSRSSFVRYTNVLRPSGLCDRRLDFVLGPLTISRIVAPANQCTCTAMEKGIAAVKGRVHRCSIAGRVAGSRVRHDEHHWFWSANVASTSSYKEGRRLTLLL
jgi:hypothetical protein